MTELLQQLANALALGGTYALLALGLALVFSILGFINFAHGELMTLAGYAIVFSLALGLPFLVGLIGALVAATCAAMAMERVAFRPFRGADATTLLITSFALSLLLHVVFQDAISPRAKGVDVPAFLQGNVTIFSISVGRIQLSSILVTAAALVGLIALLRRTTVGLTIRAAAEDFSTTRLMGVPADRVIQITFAISGVLAGIAGALWVAQRGSVDPLMGFVPVLKAFIAVVIGGLGSLSGAVAGGFLLGGLEVLLRAYLPDGLLPFRDAILLSLLIAVLILRPQGIFGQDREVRA